LSGVRFGGIFPQRLFSALIVTDRHADFQIENPNRTDLSIMFDKHSLQLLNEVLKAVVVIIASIVATL
jgi:hypothetical protein